MVFNQIKDVMMIETEILRELLGLLFLMMFLRKACLDGWSSYRRVAFRLSHFPALASPNPNASLNWMEDSAPAALGL